jgi:mono/diheme cytochrome c family protein
MVRIVAIAAAAALLATLSLATAATRPNPSAGKKLFKSLGCGACHTMAPAGTHGKVGPNLNLYDPPYVFVVQQITHGGGGMPAFGKRLSKTQLRDLAAFVYNWTSRG